MTTTPKDTATKPTPASTSAIEAGYIYFDGDIVPQEEAKVSVLTHALHYGTSVFEGIRAYETSQGAAIFRLNEHSKRLLESAKIIGMKPAQTLEQINQAIIDTVRKNNRKSCYIRPLLWYGAEALGVNPGRNKIHMMVATWNWGTYLGDDAVKQGAKLMTSSWRRSPGDVMPTKAKAGGNYINSVLANSEARDHGYDEALLLDKDGFVAEGAGENIFMYRDGILYPISHSVNLRGITRDSVIQIAKYLGTPVEPTMATRDELYTADEVFMVGTADRRPIGSGKAGEYSLKLRETYLNAVTGKLPEFDHWLTYVK
jgi:branched-chain amino acid aminotransferase